MQEQPQNHGWNAKSKFIFINSPTGESPKQHLGRGTQVGTQALRSSVHARGSSPGRGEQAAARWSGSCGTPPWLGPQRCQRVLGRPWAWPSARHKSTGACRRADFAVAGRPGWCQSRLPDSRRGIPTAQQAAPTSPPSCLSGQQNQLLWGASYVTPGWQLSGALLLTSPGCRWRSAPPWTSMGCRDTACLTMRPWGCRGISAPAPGAPPPPASSPTLESEELLLSHLLTPLSHCSLFPFLTILSQRCYHCCWWAWPWPVAGPSWSQLPLGLLDMGEASSSFSEAIPVAPLLPKPCKPDTCDLLRNYF